MVHITPLFFCLKVRNFLSTWKADYCCECRCCLVCLMGILGKPSNPNVGSYKSRGQYKESFLTSSHFWFDGFSQYCFPESGEPRRIQVQPWRSQWPCRAGNGYLAVTQAVLGPLPANHCQLWALASRWAREGGWVCVSILPFPLVSGKLEIDFCLSGEGEEGRKSSACLFSHVVHSSLPTCRSASCSFIWFKYQPLSSLIPLDLGFGAVLKSA